MEGEVQKKGGWQETVMPCNRVGSNFCALSYSKSESGKNARSSAQSPAARDKRKSEGSEPLDGFTAAPVVIIFTRSFLKEGDTATK